MCGDEDWEHLRVEEWWLWSRCYDHRFEACGVGAETCCSARWLLPASSICWDGLGRLSDGLFSGDLLPRFYARNGLEFVADALGGT